MIAITIAYSRLPFEIFPLAVFENEKKKRKENWGKACEMRKEVRVLKQLFAVGLPFLSFCVGEFDFQEIKFNWMCVYLTFSTDQKSSLFFFLLFSFFLQDKQDGNSLKRERKKRKKLLQYLFQPTRKYLIQSFFPYLFGNVYRKFATVLNENFLFSKEKQARQSWGFHLSAVRK